MEHVIHHGHQSNSRLMWLEIVLGSLMVCPKLLSAFQGWEKEIGEREGKGQPN